VSRNYTACEVNGVVLSADLVSTPTIYDALMRIALKMGAVKVEPYSPETYRQILQEVEENSATSRLNNVYGFYST
jgi:hypothetical protein